MCGGDKDRATGVSSLTNEEPLVVVKACVDIVWEVVGEDCGDSRYSVVREGGNFPVSWQMWERPSEGARR